ncbi:Uncharacterized protein MSYG_3298 [Malassezia sympodialis ATCC 42132]|uniref:Uncharacterized protein n=1 Tax=Malassezia sympodialis (strain ATCC 42132) TaxID=1230383 RepID=A0A1M8A954_MALS4|nr:Uncharacterized protein MSYG_3298 [Malassezia sympodialis ATCC 42132]
MGFFSSNKEAQSVSPEPIDKVEVGRTLLNKLEQVSPDPSVPAPDLSRQEQLDAAIQKKLHEELGKLRKQEKEVQTQIELALEKENLDKQAKSWFSRDKGQSSVLLQQELDRVKAQNEKYQHRSVADYPELQKARDAVSQCFLENKHRTLDCWKEVEAFKKAMADAEKTVMATWK